MATCNDVWGYWNGSSSTNVATTASTSDYIWQQWCDGGTSSATTSTTVSSTDQNIWVTWVSDSTADSTSHTTDTIVWRNWNEAEYVTQHIETEVVPETEQEREARLEREHEFAERQREADERMEREREERERKAAEHERKREEAEKTAQLLLKELIGEDQFKIYQETGRVLVKGRKQDYVVQKNGPIIQVKKDKLVDMCVHLENKSRFPETDNVIGMALALKHDEERVLKLANQREWTKRDKELLKAACI